jgi:hypothetical protein
MHLKPIVALVPVSVLVTILYETILRSAPVLSAGAIGVMLLLGLFIAASYLGVLYLLGTEKEDLLIWNEVRFRRI